MGLFGPKKGTLDWHWLNSQGKKLTNPNFPMYKRGKSLEKEHVWYIYLNYKFPIAKAAKLHQDINDFEQFIGFTDETYIKNFREVQVFVRYEGFIVSETFGSGHTVPLPEKLVNDTGWVVYE